MPDPLKGILKTLKEHVDRLNSLLEDPHPGLWSWCNCVAQQVKAIAVLYDRAALRSRLPAHLTRRTIEAWKAAVQALDNEPACQECGSPLICKKCQKQAK